MGYISEGVADKLKPAKKIYKKKKMKTVYQNDGIGDICKSSRSISYNIRRS
jgi:hypothetical protein